MASETSKISCHDLVFSVFSFHVDEVQFDILCCIFPFYALDMGAVIWACWPYPGLLDQDNDNRQITLEVYVHCH